MKRKRRKEEETNAESKGRQRAVDFLSSSLWMRSKSAILVSNSVVSFSCTVLSSVLALIPSICLRLVSSKYCLPRAAAIQRERKKHKEWWGRRDEGENQNIQIFPFRLFLLFVLDPYGFCCFLRLNVFCFTKLSRAPYFVRYVKTNLLKLSNINVWQLYNI